MKFAAAIMQNKYGSDDSSKIDAANTLVKLKVVPTEIAENSSEYAPDTPTIANIVFSQLSAVEVAQTGVPTRTTPTLTPTTLKNIEQLLDLPSSVSPPPEAHSNQAGFVPPPVFSTASSTYIDAKSWGGGITTISTVNDNSSNTLRDMRMPVLLNSTEKVLPKRVGGRRPANLDRLSPEEDMRRKQRRERNKEAAARCRKRRLDQTNRLQDETDELENRKDKLKHEIEMLQQQKEELEYILSVHKPMCKKNAVVHPTLEIKKEADIEEKVIAKKIYFPQRPTSLPLARGVSEIGISIETPSNALQGFSTLDSIMDGGSTGFTPVSSGIMPLTTTSSDNTLNTPIIATTCGNQQRSNVEISSSDPVPKKLVSL